MRKGFTLSELLIFIVIVALFGFVIWSIFKGTPNMRMFAGIGLIAMFLPATISGIIHGTLRAGNSVIMMIGALLIASKFIF